MTSLPCTGTTDAQAHTAKPSAASPAKPSAAEPRRRGIDQAAGTARGHADQNTHGRFDRCLGRTVPGDLAAHAAPVSAIVMNGVAIRR